MKTYLLEAKSIGEMESIAEKLRRDKDFSIVRVKRRRCIAVGRGEPPRRCVREEVDGDQSAIVSGTWLSRSILDDLHNEFVERAPVSRRVQTAAVRRWKKSVARRQAAEEELELSTAAEREARADLIRTQGRAPIVIDGQMYDFGCADEIVTIFPRKIGKHG